MVTMMKMIMVITFGVYDTVCKAFGAQAWEPEFSYPALK